MISLQPVAGVGWGVVKALSPSGWEQDHALPAL